MNPKYKKIITPLAILTIGSVILSLFKVQKLSLVSSSPTNNSSLSNLNQPILLEFNQKINLEDLKFQIVPEEKFAPSKIENTKVMLTFNKVFQINTNYLVTILYKEKQLDQINFTTTISPNTQYDARFLEEVQNNMDDKYPLMVKTPYISPQFRVVYSAPLTLEITLTNPNLTSSEAIEEVKSWVTQNGGDVAAHTFVIATP